VSRKKHLDRTTIVIHASPELAWAVDEWVVGLGLDSRSAAAAMLIQAGLSAVPIDTVVYEVLQHTRREMQKAEFQALADHYQTRANLFRAAAQ
jgi:hypothetical protein